MKKPTNYQTILKMSALSAVMLVALVTLAACTNQQTMGNNTTAPNASNNAVTNETTPPPADNTMTNENAPAPSDNMMTNETTSTPSDSSMMEEATPTPADGAMTDQTVINFKLTGENFKFVMNGQDNPTLRVKKGDKVMIELTSTGGTHDWVVDEFNAATKRVNTGETATVEFTADQTGTFEYYCSVNSHRALGMHGQLIVE